MFHTLRMLLRSKPLIGVVCRRTFDPASGRDVFGVQEPYVRAINDAGGVPFLIPLESPPESIRQLFEVSDGVLLCGGEDLHPSAYRQPPSPHLGCCDRARDEVDLALAKLCVEHKKPVLGVCRGCQVLNVACGGSLVQHIESGAHRVWSDDHPAKDEFWAKEAHTIKVAQHSRLFDLLKGKLGAGFVDGVASCNSVHHQCCERLGDGLTVTAVADDGVVEAFEGGEGMGFLMGIQSHPEAYGCNGKHKEWLCVFEALVKASAKAK